MMRPSNNLQVACSRKVLLHQAVCFPLATYADHSSIIDTSTQITDESCSISEIHKEEENGITKSEKEIINNEMLYKI